MQKRLWITMVAAMVAVVIGSSDFAFGRGGRGGGGGGGARGGGGFSGGGGRPSGGFSGGGGARPSGGFSGGGGGRSVGSSPSFSRPSGGASRPSMPTTRPSPGAGSRPNVGGGNVGAGNRPNFGAGSGSRPSTLPANRPGIGSGQGIGAGQGIANRPGAGQGIANRPGAGQGIANRPGAGQGIANRPGVGTGQGIANRPGISQLPARLPGLGEGGAGSRLPNQGANRPQTLEGRRGDLSNRMTSGRGEWNNNRQNLINNSHHDWHGMANVNINNHGNWYHGCWNGGWYGGAGWNRMWNNYPVAAAFGLTAWGVNRIAYGWGYWGYNNPYATSSTTYNYSQPIVVYEDSGNQTAPADPAAAPPAAPTEITDAGAAALDDARTAFHDGDSAKALTLLDTAVKETPNDTVVHEFRGLVLFSLKRYPESAAATYAVLSAGPGWDWTTMIGLYPNVEVYTQQLRALETFAKANPKSPDAHFLLGYQYLTTGYAESASKQFKLAQSELPNDKLLKQLVGMTTPPDESKQTETPPAPADVPPEKVLSTENLVGTWKASNQDAQFQLDLAKDGSFVWTYSRGKDKQTMKGVFAVDQNNLALEPEAGGTMLAEVDFADPSQFLFKMIGGDAKDPGLQFKKN